MLFDLLSPPASAAAACASSATAPAATATATATATAANDANGDGGGGGGDDDDAAATDADVPSLLIVDESQPAYARSVSGGYLPPVKPSTAGATPQKPPRHSDAPDGTATVDDGAALSGLWAEWARPALIVTTPLCFLAAAPALVLLASVMARRRSRGPRTEAGLL